MAATVTLTALRFALTRIAEEVCRTGAILIRVAEAPFQPRAFFAVSIPFEFRADLCHYLAENLDLSFRPTGPGDPHIRAGWSGHRAGLPQGIRLVCRRQTGSCRRISR